MKRHMRSKAQQQDEYSLSKGWQIQGNWSGVRIGVEQYGPGDDHWVYVVEPADPNDHVALSHVDRLCAIFRRVGPGEHRTVSGPKVRELAARLEALVDWSAQQPATLEGYAAVSMSLPSDKRAARLLLEAKELEIPMALLGMVAIQLHGDALAGRPPAAES